MIVHYLFCQRHGKVKPAGSGFFSRRPQWSVSTATLSSTILAKRNADGAASLPVAMGADAAPDLTMRILVLFEAGRRLSAYRARRKDRWGLARDRRSGMTCRPGRWVRCSPPAGRRPAGALAAVGMASCAQAPDEVRSAAPISRGRVRFTATPLKLAIPMTVSTPGRNCVGRDSILLAGPCLPPWPARARAVAPLYRIPEPDALASLAARARLSGAERAAGARRSGAAAGRAARARSRRLDRPLPAGIQPVQ